VIVLDLSGKNLALTKPLKLEFGEVDFTIEAIKTKIFESVQVYIRLEVRKPPKLYGWELIEWLARWDQVGDVHELTILAPVKVTKKARYLTSI